MSAPSFTLGIEEEYQTIDPGDVRSALAHQRPRSSRRASAQLKERVKAEMHQSVVEVGTGVCRNIEEARDDISDLRRQMIALAERERPAARRRRARIRSPTGARRRSIPTSATCRSSRTCRWSRART